MDIELAHHPTSEILNDKNDLTKQLPNKIPTHKCFRNYSYSYQLHVESTNDATIKKLT